MKRYDNLFSQIADIDNLYLAFKQSCKGHKYAPEVLKFSNCIATNLENLKKSLEEGTWKSGKYTQFISQREVKRRVINAPSFRDRILHHAIGNIVQDKIEQRFIEDTYAVIKGRGQHKAVARAQLFIRKAQHEGTVYVLQCDISKYFDNINHDILIKFFERHIKDKKCINLFRAILDGYFTSSDNVGVPIGALFSQLCANLYLNELDHKIKEQLNVKYYVRYMDDFIIMANNKEILRQYKKWIVDYLEKVLQLKINPKTKIFPAKQGLDFVGYRIWATHILPRKRTIKAAKIRFKSINKQYFKWECNVSDVTARVNSFLGYIKHCQGFRTANSTIGIISLKRDNSGSNIINKNRWLENEYIHKIFTLNR